MTNKVPRVLDTQCLAETRLFRIEQVELQFSNGTKQPYERLLPAYDGAVMIIPMLDHDTVLLIREYAAGTHRYELMLPKGRVENNENVLDAANREIQEEIGYAAKQLQHISTYTAAPGLMAHQTYVVLAQALYPQKLKGDEPEEIKVIPWKLSDLSKLFERPDFSEARTIAALYQAKEILAK